MVLTKRGYTFRAEGVVLARRRGVHKINVNSNNCHISTCAKRVTYLYSSSVVKINNKLKLIIS